MTVAAATTNLGKSGAGDRVEGGREGVGAAACLRAAANTVGWPGRGRREVDDKVDDISVARGLRSRPLLLVQGCTLDQIWSCEDVF